MSQRKTRKTTWLFLILAAAAVGGIFWVFTRIYTTASKPIAATKTQFNRQLYSMDSPTSPWVIVNKQRPLDPLDYAPQNLDKSTQLNAEAAEALNLLISGAKNSGVNIKIVSSYRSYQTQSNVYDSEVRGFGQQQADRESARPGHSEHQTGWAADLGNTNGNCEVNACFGDTAAGKWLAQNAHKYGFIIRYPKGKEQITGFIYEPWHLRYVGRTLAIEMYKTPTKTLEEFFNLPPAPIY